MLRLEERSRRISPTQECMKERNVWETSLTMTHEMYNNTAICETWNVVALNKCFSTLHVHR